MNKLINPYLNKEGYNCFGCSPNNPIGLHLEFWEDGEDVVTTWSPSINYDGWVETLHGGIISTLIDELANWVLSRRLQAAGVTTKLEVKFRRPVSTRDTTARAACATRATSPTACSIMTVRAIWASLPVSPRTRLRGNHLKK